jgi:phospholipase C
VVVLVLVVARLVGDGDAAALSAGTSFVKACETRTLPNVCYIDPAFDNEATGTAGDDHPLADIRLGERFIADAYHALAANGYLDKTVFIVTFDEWGGFYDHVPPPQVIDDTNPKDVMHAGDSSTPTDGRLYPNYKQRAVGVPGTGESSAEAADLRRRPRPDRDIGDGRPQQACAMITSPRRRRPGRRRG